MKKLASRYTRITRCAIYSFTLFNFCYLFRAYVIRGGGGGVGAY